MPDLTPLFTNILNKHNARPSSFPGQRLDTKDDFINEAYRIVPRIHPLPPILVPDPQLLCSTMLTICASLNLRTPTSPLSTSTFYPFAGRIFPPLFHPVVQPPQTLPTQRSPTLNVTSSIPRPKLCYTRSQAQFSSSRRLRVCGKTRNGSFWPANAGEL